MAKLSMKDRGWAELGGTARFGLQDAQTRIMGEFAGPTQNHPFQAGSVQQREPGFDEILDKAAEAPAREPSKSLDLDMG